MTIDRAYLDYVAARDESPARWERLKTGEPSVYYFWHRQGPRHLFLPWSYSVIFEEPAWDGAYPSRPDIRVRVEAASYRGRPVYFEVVNPWDRPVRDVGRAESPGQRAPGMVVIALFIMALVGGALLALRNLRLGRGDRRGAFRHALFMFAARMLVEWVFGAHHFGSPGEEFILLRFLAYLVPKRQGRPPDVPIGPDAESYGMAGFPAGFANQIHAAAGNSFVALLLMLLLFIVVRRTWLAAPGAYLVTFGMAVLSIGVGSPLSLPFVALMPLPVVASPYRYGLLASVSGLFVVHLWVFFPVTAELSAWYASGFVLDALICAALVVYGFYTSLAGEPVFRDDLLKV